MSKFKRILEFAPAFDRRDPNPSKNYGIGGLSLFAAVVGPLGAIQYRMSFPLYLPGSLTNNAGFKREIEIHRKWEGNTPVCEETIGACPTDLGYHSPKPTYVDQASMGPCEILDGAECWYDGSSLMAMDGLEQLVAGGSDGLFAYLEKRYVEQFECND